MSISLSYGRHGNFTCEIDPRRIVAHHAGPGQCVGLSKKVRTALESPLDFPALSQVCIPGDNVVVALDRHTPCAAELIVEIWTMLESRGVDAAAVEILQPVALDSVPLLDPRLHLPEPIKSQFRWTIHDPTDPKRQAYLAATARGERIYLARELVVAAVDADSAGHGWDQIGAALATARNLVAKGGKIVLLSELDAEPEIGIELIRKSESPRSALAPIRKTAPVDMIPARQFASAADWARVYLVSKLPPGMVDELFMVPIENDRELTRLLSGEDSCVILGSAQHTYGEVRRE